jgi:YD repeat-containing protein
MGRPYQVSNPYRVSQGESPAYTTTLYDSLSRTISVTTTDGATTTFANSNNQVTTTDSAGAARKTTADSLGRITQINEDPAHANFQTTYTYNAAGSLLSVNQAGCRLERLPTTGYSA